MNDLKHAFVIHEILCLRKPQTFNDFGFTETINMSIDSIILAYSGTKPRSFDLVKQFLLLYLAI